MKKLIILFIAIMRVFPAYAGDDAFKPKNYCNDQSSWKEWDELIAKYPNDDDVQILHALRIGLCMKIEQGSISLEKAIELFDRAHELVIKQAERQQKKKSAL